MQKQNTRRLPNRAKSMKEYDYDKLLHVKTEGNKYVHYPDSVHQNPYEPTPYEALDVLFQSYKLKKGCQVIDFGSGKGRLGFYLHHFHRVTVKGIEMDEDLVEESLVNLQNYNKYTKSSEGTIEFLCCLAEEYRIAPEDTHFYFFHPFSITIFRNIISRILQSIEENYREVDLILYYPHDNYIDYLERETMFEQEKEVMIPGLYEHDPYERVLIYRLEI